MLFTRTVSQRANIRRDPGKAREIFLTDRKYVYKDPATPECTLVDRKAGRRVGSPIREFCFRESLISVSKHQVRSCNGGSQNAFPVTKAKPRARLSLLRSNTRDRQEIVARVKIAPGRNNGTLGQTSRIWCNSTGDVSKHAWFSLSAFLTPRLLRNPTVSSSTLG